jgi:hypothetical protein
MLGDVELRCFEVLCGMLHVIAIPNCASPQASLTPCASYCALCLMLAYRSFRTYVPPPLTGGTPLAIACGWGRRAVQRALTCVTAQWIDSMPSSQEGELARPEQEHTDGGGHATWIPCLFLAGLTLGWAQLGWWRRVKVAHFTYPSQSLTDEKRSRS